MSQTEIERHRARKLHHCDGCGGDIRPGQVYERWRWFGEWGAVTVESLPALVRRLNRGPT